MNIKFISAAIFLVISLSLLSCGYRMAGRGGHIPSEVRAIAIPVFENRTMEPIVEEELTPAVLKGFIRDSRIAVRDRSEADLVLHGSITSYQESPLSFDQDQNVLEYRIMIKTHLRLLQQSTNKVIWQQDLMQSAEYSVSSDVMKTRNLKLSAIREIANNLAEAAADRVLRGW